MTELSKDSLAWPELSVVVPAYQEEDRVGDSLTSLRSWLSEQVESWEIIVVDDGSNDRTSSVVGETVAVDDRCRLISYRPNRGKGYAVRTGLAASRGKVVLYTDADLSTPPQEIATSLVLLQDHDVVAGTRARRESNLVVRQAWYREGMGRVFNLLLRGLGLASMPDTQCGFKAFRGPVARKLAAELIVDGFAFDVELLARAARSGLRIVEQPVQWHNHPDSRVHAVRDSLQMIGQVLRIAWMLRHQAAGPR